MSKLNARVNGGLADSFYGAPTIVVVLAEHFRRAYVDGGNMVIANLLNAAYAVGVDSCYIYRVREVSSAKKRRVCCPGLSLNRNETRQRG